MEKRRVAVVAHVPPSSSSQVTGSERALSGLAALGQPTRLEIFRLLIRHEPDGLQAKAISEAVNMAHNTLSTHLAILARAGLVTGERQGRLIIYRANIQGIRSLISFLVTDCCQGHPELCCFSADVASIEGVRLPGATMARSPVKRTVLGASLTPSKGSMPFVEPKHRPPAR